MKRLTIWFGLGVGLFVMAVILSPYYTLYRLKAAYDKGDYAYVAAMVDYEQVQTHLKQELNARFDHTINSNTSLAQLAMIFPDAKAALMTKGQSFIDNSVDSAITADNLGKLLANDITPQSKQFVAAWAVASDYIDYQKLVQDIIVLGGDWQSASAAQEPIVRERIIQKFGQAASDTPTFGYCGYDCFYVSGNVSGQPIGATLYRQGLFAWRIGRVQLP